LFQLAALNVEALFCLSFSLD